MIDYISIKDFAIIENTEMYFEKGLNIITGETGSGKSIVVEAMSLALGARADSSYVRTGKEKAIVQLSGKLGGEEIVILREVSATGKNLCKLNGVVVTLAELNETCKKIADIHGQYDNQYLLNIESHLQLLDTFNKQDLSEAKKDYVDTYNSYINTKQKLASLQKVESDNNKRHDFLTFEVNEIKNASLVLGEDVELEESIAILQNSEKIATALNYVNSGLLENEHSMISALHACMGELNSISSFSTELKYISEDFNDIYYKLEDLSRNIRNVNDGIYYDPQELDAAITRYELIKSLKKKYGNTIESILEYADKCSEELYHMENHSTILEELQKEMFDTSIELEKKAKALTGVRKCIASDLTDKLEKELKDLNFEEASILIEFKEAPSYQYNGNDIVEILISTNKGEPLKPLVKVASGGEISRIMLAFKCVTAQFDSINTMIFDEIDSGISGITASIVSKKLLSISKTHQIICITHLPQIAAKGDYNFRIYKVTKDNATATYVRKLTEDEKIDEVARLIGGTFISEITKKSAIELIIDK